MKILLFIRRIIYRICLLVDVSLDRKNGLFILCYHSLVNDGWRFSVDPNIFKKQMKWLVKRYKPINLDFIENYLQGKTLLSEPSFALTFDDGYKDLLNATKICKKLGISPTVFVLSQPEKVNKIETGTDRPLLSPQDIKKLLRAGWNVGLHSATHPNLVKLSKPEIRNEIHLNKKSFEKKIGTTINYFAYPKGKYNSNILEIVKQSGYRLALSMDDERISAGTGQFQIPRVGIDRSHTFSEFKSAFSPTTIRFKQLISFLPFKQLI